MKLLMVLPFIYLLVITNTYSSWINQWEKYKNLSSLESEFIQEKHLKDLDIVLKTKGKITLKVPDQFSCEIESEQKLKYVFNKDGFKIYQNGKETRSITNNQMGAELLKPIQMLKGWLRLDINFIKANYQVNSKGKNLFEFIPKKIKGNKNSNELFTGIIIKSGSKYPIKEMTLLEKNGDSLKFTFKNEKISYGQ